MGFGENETGFTRQFQQDINGQVTEFVFQRFANKWFLIITQYASLPNLYTVQFDVQRDAEVASVLHTAVEDPQFHTSVPLTMNCNFGADKDEVRSGIQFLVNKSKLNCCPNEFIISLGLKQINGQNLREIARVLDEIIT